MGDAFKGLTIRIGADARPLSSALSSIKTQANEAQRSISRLTRSLRFDGNDVAAMSARINLMDDRILLAARSANVLRTSLTQASAQTRKLAANTANVHAAAQRAKDGFNAVDTALQRGYDAMKEFKSASDGISLKKASKQINAMKADAEALASVVRGMFESGRELPFGIQAKSADEAYLKALATIRSLKAEQKSYNAQLTRMNEAKAFVNARNDLVLYEAELRKAATEQVRFQAELMATGGSQAFASLRADVKAMDSAVDSASASARKMSAAYDMMPRSIDHAKAKLQAIRSEQAAVNGQIDKIKAAMRELEAAPGFDKAAAGAANLRIEAQRAERELVEQKVKVAALSEEYDRLGKDARAAMIAAKAGSEGASASVLELNSRLRATGASLHAERAAMAGMERTLASMRMALQHQDLGEQLAYATAHYDRLSKTVRSGVNWANIGASVKNLGYAMYSTLTPAIMIGARYAVQAAEDVDSAYRDMRKTVNGTEEQFEALKDAAIDFSRTHVTSADTLLGIESLGGQLGIAVENLGGFSEVISSLDIATNIEAEDLATYVGQLSNIMDDMRVHKDDPKGYQESITSFADALVRLGNNSAAQESNIMNVMMRIASLGNISGFTTPQLLAISDAVAATGQGSEAAGTAISKTFSNIETAVGKGGDALKGFADVAGMSSERFAKSWNETPMEAFTAFIGGLRRIDQEGGSVDRTLGGLGINAVRQKQALMGLTTTFDVMTGATKMADDAWNGLSTDLGNGKIEEAGDAAREAQRKSEGFSGQLAMMKNNATAMAVELGDGFVPFMHALSSTFQDFTGALAEMPPEMKTAITGLLAFTAAAGPAAVGIGSFLTAVTNIRKALGGIPKAWNDVIKGLSRLSTAGLAKTLGSQLGKSLEVDVGIPITKVGAKFDTLKGKVGSFVKAAGPGGMAILSIAAVGLGMEIKAIADHYAKVAKRAEEMKAIGTSSFDAMSDAAKRSSAKIGSSIGDVVENRKLLDYLKEGSDGYDEWISERAASKERIKELATETFGNVAVIERDADTISALMAKAGAGYKLTESEQARLTAAVESFNEATGESISVVSAENGVLADSTGKAIKNAQAFNELAEAKKYASIQKYWGEASNDSTKSQVENSNELAKAEGDLEKARELFGYYQRLEAGFDQFGTAHSREYEEALDSYNKLIGRVAKLRGEQGELAKDAENNATMYAMAAKKSKTNIEKMLLDPASKVPGILDENGQRVSSFVDALNSLGPAAQNLSPDKVEELAHAWNVDLASILPLLRQYGIGLDALDRQQINGKEFYVTDNGTIVDAEGNLQYLHAFQIGDKRYWVGDDGSVYDEKGKLDELDGVKIDDKWYIVRDDGSVIDQLGRVQQLRAIQIGDKHYFVTSDGSVKDETGDVTQLDSFKIGDKTYVVDDKGSVWDSRGKVEGLDGIRIGNKPYIVDDRGSIRDQTGKLERFDTITIDDKPYYVDDNGTVYDNEREIGKLDEMGISDKDYDAKTGKLTDEGKAKLDGIIRALGQINDKTVNVTVNEWMNKVETTVRKMFTQKEAAGGFYRFHANGGFVTDGVTDLGLDRYGVRHIAGEAGREWVMQHADGTKSIVPVQNRRYLEPYAGIIASMITPTQAAPVNVTMYVTAAPGMNEEQFAGAVERRLKAHIAMGGR